MRRARGEKEGEVLASILNNAGRKKTDTSGLWAGQVGQGRAGRSCHWNSIGFAVFVSARDHQFEGFYSEIGQN